MLNKTCRAIYDKTFNAINSITFNKFSFAFYQKVKLKPFRWLFGQLGFQINSRLALTLEIELRRTISAQTPDLAVAKQKKTSTITRMNNGVFSEG